MEAIIINSWDLANRIDFLVFFCFVLTSYNVNGVNVEFDIRDIHEVFDGLTEW